MNKRRLFFPILLSFMLLFPGCELIEDVFQAGIWFAIIAILIIVALIVLIFSVGKKPEKEAVVLSKTDSTKKFPKDF